MPWRLPDDTSDSGPPARSRITGSGRFAADGYGGRFRQPCRQQALIRNETEKRVLNGGHRSGRLAIRPVDPLITRDPGSIRERKTDAWRPYAIACSFLRFSVSWVAKSLIGQMVTWGSEKRSGNPFTLQAQI